MQLASLTVGMPIVWGGNQVTTVSDELAAAFVEGDRLIVVQDTGDLLHVPQAEWQTAAGTVDRAVAAFEELRTISDDAVTAFYREFAARLAADVSFAPIAEANRADIDSARKRSSPPRCGRT